MSQIGVAVTVPIYQDFQDEDGTKYTAYIVKVQTTLGDTWELKKRYSDFNELHLQLLKHIPNLNDFKFPHKSVFNTFSDFTKLRRLSGFQEYVKVLMEIKPRPVELDQFLELDDHMLNRNSITSVTASSRQKDGSVIHKTSSDEATSASSHTSSPSPSSSKTAAKRKKKTNMEIPRIVVSSFVTMMLVFWALGTANVIDMTAYTSVRMALTLLSLGSVCTFMRIALLKREQLQAKLSKPT